MKINLNTLKYVVAVDSHRNFVKAAEACGVSQPALSAAIKNMEEELDTVIFDRNSHPARPTPSGEKIISMARATLRNASMIEEFVLGERGGTGGEVSIGTIPTVAPYVLPGLFREMRGSWPDVRLKVSEMRTASLMEKLRSDEIDIAIMSTPLGQKGLLEIPLYYEKFFAYVSPSDELYALEEIPSEKLPSERFWILEEGHCLRSQVLNFCSGSRRSHTEYQAGSIETLVRVVDMNGGYTVIPELHRGSIIRPGCTGRRRTMPGLHSGKGSVTGHKRAFRAREDAERHRGLHKENHSRQYDGLPPQTLRNQAVGGNRKIVARRVRYRGGCRTQAPPPSPETKSPVGAIQYNGPRMSEEYTEL